jgi:hypothetical protein
MYRTYCISVLAPEKRACNAELLAHTLAKVVAALNNLKNCLLKTPHCEGRKELAHTTVRLQLILFS